MNIQCNPLSGDYIQFHCSNEQGFSVDILNLGGIIQKITLPNGSDVVLGYDDPQEYLKNSCYFGAIIGPYVNRVSNAEIRIHDQIYALDKNDGNNNLHGGDSGFHQKIFRHRVEEDTLILETTSPHLEGGFPGNLEVEVHYKLEEDCSFSIEYFAKADEDTVVNLTSHSYFNLSTPYRTCRYQELQLFAETFTVNDKEGIPTGEIKSVEGTPLDFRTGKNLGDDLDSKLALMTNPSGYDHNFIVNDIKTMKTIAIAKGSSANLTVESNAPCVQLYTGNFIPAHDGKNKVLYRKHSGFCLETACYPNAINLPSFPDDVLKAGDVWNYKTIYRFESKEKTEYSVSP